MLMLDSLIVMHDEIRDGGKLAHMVDYVREGGMWTMEAIKKYAAESGDREEPIYITRFEDQSLYVHDGHRRITATYLGGRDFIHPSEYVLADWTFHDYEIIKWDKNYVTPHDPRTEIRLADFFGFKKKALRIRDEFGIVNAEKFIWANKSLYCRPRSVWKVPELARMALRCNVTNNCCGTDTWTVGYTCPCHSCKLWVWWWSLEEQRLQKAG